MSRWLVDIDSTFMDTTTGLMALVNDKFGHNYNVEDLRVWHWEHVFPADVCEFVWESDHGFKNLDFHRTAGTVLGSLEVLRQMQVQGEVLYFVSDRPYRLYEVTREWLNSHGFHHSKLVFTDREDYPKVLAAKQFGLEFVVEDAPHHAVDLANADHIQRVYLLDYPYNRNVPDHPKITRVSDWAELAGYVIEREARAA